MLTRSHSICPEIHSAADHANYSHQHKPNQLFAVLVVLVMIFCGAPGVGRSQTKTATATTLTVTSGGSATSTVAAGSVVTLTASVAAGSAAVTVGQVNFCDASVTYCTDIHLLGTLQLTSAGTAVLKFRPGIGSHSYKAVFLGTNTLAASSSGPSLLAVSGKYATATVITQGGGPGDYSLTATVTGSANSASVAAPEGTISFIDTSNTNAVLGTATLGAGVLGLGFVNSSNPATVPEPNVVATADFNGDGIPDIAVSNSNSGQTYLTILLGKGDGTFTATATNPTVGLYPDCIAVGDFNGDGIPDLAVTSVDDDAVTILLGKGDGTFSAVQGLDTASTPQSAAVADFNHDGIADIAVVNGDSVLIFLGNGDGTFQSAVSEPLGVTAPLQVAVGDFNGDGIPDLAVTNSVESGTVVILLGNGDGTFAVQSTQPVTGPSPSGIAVADFNGDGILDLAVTDYGGDSGNAVTIIFGNGDGTFKAPAYYGGEGLNYQSVVMGDFNGDGVPDLAVGEFLAGISTLLLGMGDGTFGSPVAVDVNAALSSGYIAAADFNGDGIPDLAIPNEDVNGTVSVLLVNPTQTATALANGVSPTGPGTHLVEASYPGDSTFKSSVSATVALTAAVATPVISPASGTITTAQSITVTDSTPGATIYYSLAGATYSPNWVKYTGPIPIEGSGALGVQAYATATGYDTSPYASANYTLNLPAATGPVLSVASGLYPSAQTVTITDNTPGATIYYTTNGTYPSAYATAYSGPITVSTSEILTAVAIAPGYAYSSFAIADYEIASSSTRFIYTLAGNDTFGYTGDAGPATYAELGNLAAVATDSAGNVYVADSNFNVVRKIAAGTGVITTIAGTGFPGHTGDSGLATSAELWLPYSLAVDALGNIFIGEIGDIVVRRVDAKTGIITTFAGNPSGAGSIGGPATDFKLYSMEGLACDSLGNLYIAEEGDVVQVSASTGNISEIAGYSTNAGFGNLDGIAVDSGKNIYVSDSAYSIVDKITSQGVVSVFAGSRYGAYGGDGGPATKAGLYFPAGLAVDGAGNVYIADDFDCSIREVNTSGVINTIAGIFDDPYSSGGDGSPATDVGIFYPQAIAADTAGNIYFADSAELHVRKITVPTAPPTATTAVPVLSLAAGTYSTSQTLTMTDATEGAEIYVSLNGYPPNTQVQGYHGPIEISGDVTVQAIALAPGYQPSAPAVASYAITAQPAALITAVAGSGNVRFATSAGPAQSANIGPPQAVAFDSAGNLYIVNAVNCVVWEVAANTGIAKIVAGTGTQGDSGDGGPAASAELNYPSGVAVDSAGNIYIADTDNGRIRKVTAQTGVITTIAGPGVYSILGDGGLATSAYISYPSSITFDSAGNLYIADRDNGRIRRIDAKTGIITTVAGGGTEGQLGDGGLATAADLSYPSDITLDSAGNLYILDDDNSRIRKVSASTGVIKTIAGNGIFGASGDGGPATAAEVDLLEGIAVDGAGNVYFSNWPDTIRKVDAATGIISTVAGIGYYGYSGDGGAATAAQLAGPRGIALNAKGNLYFADSSNSRVREVIFTASAVAPAITLTPSASSITATQTLTMAVAVSGGTGNPVPTGSVSLSGGGYSSAATELTNGSAKIVIPAGSLAQGQDFLSVTYLPDLASAAEYATTTQSTSETVIASIGTATVTVTATPSVTTITDSQGVTVNISVAGGSGQPTPTGTVTLASGSYSAQQTLSASSASLGTASFDITAGTLSRGPNTLTASYSGDAIYAAASTTTSVTVSPVAMVISTPSPVSPGSSSTATVTLTAGSNYSGTMHVKCSLASSPAGAQSLPTCALSPAAVMLSAGVGGTTALTIDTTAASTTALAHPPRQNFWGIGGGGTVLAFVLFLGLPLRRRRWLSMLVLLVLITAAGAIGCGGGGGTGSVTPATTAGTYTFNVTGTDSTNSNIDVSANVTLTVQ